MSKFLECTECGGPVTLKRIGDSEKFIFYRVNCAKCKSKDELTLDKQDEKLFTSTDEYKEATKKKMADLW